ncbi:MAG: PAS domain-containing protein [Opitutae bacterium]|nr:PAS domain-containing protein [Opitutae bacterium]
MNLQGRHYRFPKATVLRVRDVIAASGEHAWWRVMATGALLGAGYWIVETGLHAYVFHSGAFTHELLHGDWNELWMRSCTAVLFAAIGGAAQWHLARDAAWARHLRRIAGAVEQAGEAVLITDATGRIEFVNPAFTYATGYTLNEVRGHSPSILKSGAQGPGQYRTIWETITAGRVWSGSIVDRRKDGSFYPALLTIAPVLDERGHVSHFVGVQRDMSHQVELEERVRHAENLKTLGTFAAGIAHDFGNALTLLSLQLQLAAQHLETRTADVSADIAKMEQLLDGAKKTVLELGAFARRGSTIALREPFQIRDWLRRHFPTFRLLLPTSLRVSLELPHREAWIQADAAALQQVLINLLQNARDALETKPLGTITLRCELVPDGRRLNAAATHLAGVACVRICVQDDGPGIDPQLTDRIFEPFFTTKGQRGSGLGLAMVRDTVQRHSGALRVISRPGEGAIFELLLPETSPFPAEPVPAPADTPGDSAKAQLI